MSTTAFHPQTNGQVERFNRTILAGLRRYCAVHAKDWDKFSNAINFGYNNTVQRATGLTPSQLVLTVPPGILSMPHAEFIDLEKLPPLQRKRRFHQRLRNLMAIAKVKLEEHQKRYNKDFDKLVKERDTDLKPGDLVFLRSDAPKGNDDDSTLMKLGEHKLRTNAIGLYRIEKVASHTVTIDQDGLIINVSRDRIVRAPFLTNSSLSNDITEDEQQLIQQDEQPDSNSLPEDHVSKSKESPSVDSWRCHKVKGDGR